MTPDVNVLVAASRQDHPHHQIAQRWLRTTVAGSAPSRPMGADLRLLTQAVAGFLRLVTNPRIYPAATPIASATAFIDDLLAVGVQFSKAQNEWFILRSLCLTQKLGANAVPDAWLAAQVLEANDTLATFDRDFVKLLPAKNLLLLPTK